MAAKTTMIRLQVGNRYQDFEFSHAETLLRITRAGWHLPEDSQYEFVNNAIRVKQHKKDNPRGEKCGIATDGKVPSAAD